MSKTVLNTKELKPDKAILIIDKIGVIGESLANEFSKDFYVVFLTARKSRNLSERIHQIVFKGKIPKVPKRKYSKIFLIDDGDSVTKQSSISFIKEAKLLNSDFYFLGSIRNYDIKHSDEIVKIYDNAKVLIFGDLFDNNLIFDRDSSISKFIISTCNERLINVPNDGLTLSFPISFNDTIKLIIKAAYLDVEEKIILLFYKNPITDISLAHIFQKIDPDIKVDFVKDKKEKNIFIPEGAKFAISKYDIKSKIEDVDLNKKRKIFISKKRKNKSKLKFFKFISITAFLLLFIFSLPLITSITYEFLGKLQLQKSFEKAKENNFNEALIAIERANSFFQISENAESNLSRQLEVINLNYNFEKLMKNSNLNEEEFSSVKNLLTGLSNIKNVFDGKSLNPSGDFEEGVNFLKKSYLGNSTGSLIDENYNLNSTIEYISTTSEVLPQVMGFAGEKKYLILFQDSTKLTPGGGKIVAIGKISLDNGKVKKFEVINSNEINDASSVKIEPPYFIKRYLKEENLNLQELNYDVDFTKNATGAMSIYSLRSDDEIDGVIGTDLYFLKSLLEVTGPVYIENINKNVSSENIGQLLTEGEGNIFSSIVKELENNKSRISYLGFFGIIGEMISEKHLMFAFKNPEIQNLFVKNQFSGSLVDNRTESVDKINDFLGISEYNLDLNNINNYISRRIDKINIINENKNLNSEIIISYKNNSEKSSSTDKTYKSYIQLILPLGSVIQNVSVGGRDQKIFQAITDPNIYENKDFKNVDGVEIEQKQSNDKNIFGFLVQIEPDSLQKIKVKYSLPFSLVDSKDPISYSLIVYKQPGIDSFPFTISFNKNSDYIILPNGFISEDIEKDKEFNFKIVKN